MKANNLWKGVAISGALFIGVFLPSARAGLSWFPGFDFDFGAPAPAPAPPPAPAPARTSDTVVAMSGLNTANSIQGFYGSVGMGNTNTLSNKTEVSTTTSKSFTAYIRTRGTYSVPINVQYPTFLGNGATIVISGATSLVINVNVRPTIGYNTNTDFYYYGANYVKAYSNTSTQVKTLVETITYNGVDYANNTITANMVNNGTLRNFSAIIPLVLNAGNHTITIDVQSVKWPDAWVPINNGFNIAKTLASSGYYQQQAMSPSIWAQYGYQGAYRDVTSYGYYSNAAFMRNSPMTVSINAPVDYQPVTTNFSASPTSFKFNNLTQAPVITSNQVGATYIVSGTSSAVNVGNYSMTVTGTNQFIGSKVIKWSINRGEQTISFPAISNRTVFDPPFTPTVSASSDLPVILSVDSGPATISNNVVTITGTGVVTLRATQAGNDNIFAAPPVTRTITIPTSLVITQAPLTATVTGANRVFGAPNPTGVITYTGFVNNETPATALNFIAPTISLAPSATSTAPIGSTHIWSISGGSAFNYRFTLVPGFLTILSPTPVIFNFSSLSQTYDGTAKFVGALSNPNNITFTLTYNGSPSAPTLAGSYTVTATANQIGYTGVSSNTLFVYSPLTTQVGLGSGVASGGGNFLPGSVGTISATPATNFKFDNWTLQGTGTLTGPSTTSGNGITLGNTFTRATANFSHITHNLTVSITPSTVGGSTTPSGINTVNQGDPYTLTPFQTATGHYFDRWEQTDGAGTLISTLATATDATPLQTGSITIGTGDAFVRAVYLPKTTPTIALTSPLTAISMNSEPFSLVGTTNSSNPVTFALRSPTTIATLSGSTITLTEPRTAGIIPITLSVANSRRFFSATLDADIAISSGAASITFKESSTSRFVLPGARVSANQVPQQLVNAYSDAQLLMVVPTSWKTANPISGTDTASGYLERYLLTKGDPVQARADLTAAFVAANPTTKTYYQIAADAYAAKLLADAGNTGGTTPTNPTTPTTPTEPTGTIGSASNPYISLAELGSTVPAISTNVGQTAYVGTRKYKVVYTGQDANGVHFEWRPQ